jgi:hypothetical protein
MVTHSEVCARYAGRVLRLSDGRLVDTGAGSDIAAMLPEDGFRLTEGLPL